jgi:hypothetical protein
MKAIQANSLLQVIGQGLEPNAVKNGAFSFLGR